MPRRMLIISEIKEICQPFIQIKKTIN